MAYDGLKKCNIDKDDIERYLGVIEGRCKGLTGSQWNIRSYRNLKKQMSQDNALIAMTQEMYRLHQQNKPVHTWPVMEERLPDANKSHRVGHIMSTKLFTLNENDHADLATSIMAWKNIHHLPIENDIGELAGLLTWTHMKRQREAKNTQHKKVSDIMTKDVTTVTPETEISEAIRIMKANEFGCLPIVRDRHLVGIITIHDVLPYDK
jgi:CBS domain-containing protein